LISSYLNSFFHILHYLLRHLLNICTVRPTMVTSCNPVSHQFQSLLALRIHHSLLQQPLDSCTKLSNIFCLFNLNQHGLKCSTTWSYNLYIQYNILCQKPFQSQWNKPIRHFYICLKLFFTQHLHNTNRLACSHKFSETKLNLRFLKSIV